APTAISALSLHDALPIWAWSDFRSANDPEAPTTVAGRSFPYQVPPRKLAKGSLAMPRPGSLVYQPVGGGASSTSARDTAAARLRSEEHTSELQSPYDLVC